MDRSACLGIMLAAGLAVSAAACQEWVISAQGSVPAPDSSGIAANQPIQPLNPVTSQGAGKIGSDKLNVAGYTGDGIKIAVLDTGFDIHNPEISGNVADHRSFMAGSDIRGKDFVHGTAVAEIVLDIAPDADLYLYNFRTAVEFYTLVDYLIARGDIDIVSMSISWPAFSAGDGTGRLSQKVASARDSGILWINAAGNYADKHWMGKFSDPDSDGRHNFSATDELLDIHVRNGTEAQIHLNWDDWNLRTGMQSDFDLCLYELGVELACSRDTNPGNMPFEAIKFVPPRDMTVQVAIEKQQGTRDVNFQLFSIRYPLAEYAVAKSSISPPADSRGSITVGAVNWSSYDLKKYSSQGPTLDGRTKPDISGPTDVSTSSYQHPFGGTSASAPHVAGAAALIMEKYPDATTDQVEIMLESTVHGRHAKSNKDGVGALDLKMFLGTDILALKNGDSACPTNGTCFFPSTHKIPSGSSTTWINTDNSNIQISVDNGTKSSVLARGEKYRHTFGTDGTFNYSDVLHKWATGKIIVGTGVAPRDTASPTIVSAKISGPNQISIAFSEPVNAALADFTGLTLAGQTAARTFMGISGSGSANITLTFGGGQAASAATGTMSVGTGVADTAGNAFAGQTIVQVADGQAPTVQSARITSPNAVTVQFSEPVTVTAGDFSGLTLAGQSASRTFTGISGSGSANITLTFGGGRAAADASGTMAVGAGMTDAAGNTFAGSPAISVSDGQAPTVQSARIISSDTISVRFSEPVTAAAGDFADLRVGSPGNLEPRTITSMGGSGTHSITLRVSGSAMQPGTTGSMDIAGTISDLAGNMIGSLLDDHGIQDGQRAVIVSPPIVSPPIVSPPIVSPPIVSPPIVSPPIVSPPIVSPPIVSPSDTTPPAMTAGYPRITAPDKIVVMFTENVSAELAHFTEFTVAVETRPRGLADISPKNASSTFTLTVNGTAMPANATGTINISGGISDAAGNALVAISDGPVADGQAPTVQSARIPSPNAVMVQFSEPVAAAASDFAGLTLAGQSVSRTFTGINGSGSADIILVFEGDEVAADAVGTISVGTGITDAAGNTFADQSAVQVADGQAPTVQSARITSPNAVMVQFSEPVAAAASDFAGLTLAGQSVSRTFTGINGSGSADIILVFEGDKAAADAVGTISVGTGITDAAGNTLADQPAIQVADGQAPAMTAGYPKITAPDKIVVMFTENVSAELAHFTEFTVAAETRPRGLADISPKNASSTFTLTVNGTAMPANATGTINISGGITDETGNALVAISGGPVADGQAPTVQSARITSPNAVMVQFSEPVAAAASDFSGLTLAGQSASRAFTGINGSGSADIILVFEGDKAAADAVGTISVGAGITDAAGNTLADQPAVQVADGQAPAMTAGYPRITAPDKIVVMFTENVSAELAHFTEFTVAAETRPRGLADISPRNASSTFTLTVNGTAMPANAIGMINVGGGITDRMGNALAAMTGHMVYDGQENHPNTVTGTIFVDDDWDGVRDVSESGYEGYTMYATDRQTGAVKTSVSGPDGEYSFELVPGNETVIQTSYFPTGHAVRDPGTSWFKRVTLQPDQTDTFDVGFHPVRDAEFAMLELNVFVDANKNGEIDAGEGIEGLKSFHIYTYTIGPKSIIIGANGTKTVTDQVPADFGLFVDTAMLGSEGYAWTNTTYTRSDDTAGKQYLVTYPVADDPEPGSIHRMLVELLPVRAPS